MPQIFGLDVILHQPLAVKMVYIFCKDIRLHLVGVCRTYHNQQIRLFLSFYFTSFFVSNCISDVVIFASLGSGNRTGQTVGVQARKVGLGASGEDAESVGG